MNIADTCFHSTLGWEKWRAWNLGKLTKMNTWDFRRTLIFLRFQGDKDISKWPDAGIEYQIVFAIQVICLYLNSWQILFWQLLRHFWKCLWVTHLIHQEINGWYHDCQTMILHRKPQRKRENFFPSINILFSVLPFFFPPTWLSFVVIMQNSTSLVKRVVKGVGD